MAPSNCRNGPSSFSGPTSRGDRLTLARRGSRSAGVGAGRFGHPESTWKRLCSREQGPLLDQSLGKGMARRKGGLPSRDKQNPRRAYQLAALSRPKLWQAALPLACPFTALAKRRE